MQLHQPLPGRQNHKNKSGNKRLILYYTIEVNIIELIPRRVWQELA